MKTDWQPIETAPKNGTVIILGWAHEPTWLVSSRWDEELEIWEDVGGADEDEGGYARMTHWTPMLTPPPPANPNGFRL